MQMGKTTDQGFTITGLEFMKYTSINKPCNYLLDLIGIAGIAR